MSLSKELHVPTVHNDYQSLVRKVQVYINVKETIGRDNTVRVYDPKKVKVEEYYDDIYGNEEFPRTVSNKNCLCDIIAIHFLQVCNLP